MSNELKSRRRTSLIEAAAQEFCEKGYERTRVDDIARRVGIGKSTVYEYYPSKKELFESCGIYYVGQLQQRVEQIFSQEESLRKRLEQYCVYCEQSMEHIGGDILSMTGSPEAADVIRKCVEDCVDVVSRTILQAVLQAKASGEFSQHCDVEVVAGLAILLPQMWGKMTMLKSKTEKEEMLHRFLDFIYDGATR